MLLIAVWIDYFNEGEKKEILAFRKFVTAIACFIIVTLREPDKAENIWSGNSWLCSHMWIAAGPKWNLFLVAALYFVQDIVWISKLL